jgi:hypothetical protein
MAAPPPRRHTLPAPLAPAPVFVARADGGGEEDGAGDGSGSGQDGDRKEFRAKNCNDCNKQFCMDYKLPFCEGVAEKDFFSVCFRELGSFLGCAFYREGKAKKGWLSWELS